MRRRRVIQMDDELWAKINTVAPNEGISVNDWISRAAHDYPHLRAALLHFAMRRHEYMNWCEGCINIALTVNGLLNLQEVPSGRHSREQDQADRDHGAQPG